MLAELKRRASDFVNWAKLPKAAQSEARRDRDGVPQDDPGIEAVIAANLAWIARAQDMSATADGGVARHFSLEHGWAASYPETTGYIVPTLLECASVFGDPGLRVRARRMLDWLVAIQFPEGGFQGGVVNAKPRVPVTFNTGQVIMGLAAGAREFEAYREPMDRAARWLVDTQDADGCWRRHPTPFAKPGEKTYETHVAWGLLEAAKVAANDRWAEAAMKNVRWALQYQSDSGWFERCCLEDPSQPLTHTLGYALRGVVEAYLFSRDRSLLEAARRTADGLHRAMRKDGFLPGRLRADWGTTVSWSCLTGTVQTAACWLLLYRETGDDAYLEAAKVANRYVRRTVLVVGAPDTLGAVKGSFPVDGGYARFQYPNWAAKFCADANLLERSIG